jgi:hypothetical protein
MIARTQSGRRVPTGDLACLVGGLITVYNSQNRIDMHLSYNLATGKNKIQDVYQNFWQKTKTCLSNETIYVFYCLKQAKLLHHQTELGA